MAARRATPAGQPQFFVTANGQQHQLGRYGLINSGPLMGTAFNAQGQPYAFKYGTGYQGVNIQTGLGGTVQGVAAKTAPPPAPAPSPTARTSASAAKPTAAPAPA